MSQVYHRNGNKVEIITTTVEQVDINMLKDKKDALRARRDALNAEIDAVTAEITFLQSVT